ncbi:MAG: aminotransferase class III-fold pyridoxal phosphate-dependent enzyme [Cyanobacteria bacterium J06633_8]
MSKPSIKEDKIQQLSPLQRAALALRKLDQKFNNILHEPIAIIGMGCSFPGGANTPEKFWELLQGNTSAREEIPSERWNIDEYYDPERETAGKIVTRYGHFVKSVDQFDPEFFGISPRESAAIDPQHRLLLEVSWQALERAGQKIERLSALAVGVFVGNDGHDYEQLMQEHLQQEPNSSLAIYTGTGNSISSAAGRLAYTFGFTGPTVTIDTACSSSLVAIHQACNSLRLRECEMAIAGGVKLHLTPEGYILTSRVGMISPDGLCKTFDISANGYARGEGCGMIVLKPLSKAKEDGDQILALIRGSAVNQDGPSSGLTVPNGQSQQKLIKQALKQAQIEPAEISYLEAHGTGTSLGDPIEVNAAVAVLGQERPLEQPLWVGAVKTNIGHLEAAAGVSGLIKVVLSMQHQQLPAHLHLQEPNPKIDWQPWLKVPQALTPWLAPKGRFAGVSSFGFTGTNAHVVLSEAPDDISIPRGEYERPVHLLQLSAKNEQALLELAQNYIDYLKTHPEQYLGDICFTANSCRLSYKHRLAVVAKSREELQTKLYGFIADSPKMGLTSGEISSPQLPKVAMLFTGQGSQYVGMGRQLYETQPTFKAIVDQCAEILKDYLDKPLLEILYGAEAEEGIIAQTKYTQPALFAIEYALYKLWESWGIKPDVVMGHSVGEYVAATVAGVFSLKDGLKLISHRGRLMQQLPPVGEMLSIMASEEEVNQLIARYSEKVAIAAINAPQSIVISGEAEAIREISGTLEARGTKNKQLQVSHGFHSHLMEPMLEEFTLIANQITYNQPRIPLISNVTGVKVDDSITTANYWVNHIRQPVKFALSMETLGQEGYEIFLEIGPKPILLGMGKQCLPNHGIWLPSLRPNQEDWQQILHSLAELYVKGVKVDWLGFDKDYFHKKLVLPTYPFQRKRYWVENKEHPHPKTEDISLENSLTQTINSINENINLSLEQQELFQQEDKFTVMKNTKSISARRDNIIQEVSSFIFQVLGFNDSSKINIHDNLLEMGADSLTIMEIGSKVEKFYGINIPIRKFFEELTTLDALVTYIDLNLSPELYIQSDSEKTEQNNNQSHNQNNLIPIESKVADKTIDKFRETVIQQQLEIMSKQLEILGNNTTSNEQSLTSGNKQVPSASITSTTVDSSHKIQESRVSHQKSFPPTVKLNQGLNPQQKSYLEELITTYTKKTQKSKERALAYRSVLADKRTSVGFRLELKEIKYPIVGESSHGSRIRDVDGNEYIDVSMGFGVHLFGHQPQFVIEALQNQLQQGMQIGPQAKLAGEVAQLIHELTGMERVAFCNSGTEAVMTALRLARLATGRDKIVMFSGSYHGQFDGTLAVPLTNSLENNFKSAPILPGILQKMVDDVIVLKYDDPESLEIIKAYNQELAGIIVEPVQSRHPDLQPHVFLQQIRQLTKEIGIPLIFDEIVTGFRIHPGGSQAVFGIEADITTYGKSVGGGIPIGIVTGKAAYMDGLDGGEWSYGDASYPQKLQTFFGGTFNKNPLAIAAALAVLKHLKTQGSALQEKLNQRTSKFIATLNTYFEQEYIPIKMVNFGSMFRFVALGNNELSQPIELDIFFYKLIEKGIYMWEGRNGPPCYLSTAHTDEDIEFIISSVKDTISEMRPCFFESSNQETTQMNNSETERVSGSL